MVEKLTEVEKAKQDKVEREKQDLQAQNIIITTLNEKVVTQLIACTTAQEMWSRINALYSGSSETSIHSKQMALNQLKTCGEVISENMLINKILSTLPEQYNYFYSAWDSATDKTLYTHSHHAY